MGCDETAGELVVKALLKLAGIESLVKGLESSRDPSGQRGARGGGPHDRGAARGKGRKPAVGPSPRDLLRAEARKAQQNRTPSARPATDLALEQVLDARVAEWHRSGNTVTAGNLGEQIALRVLESQDIQCSRRRLTSTALYRPSLAVPPG